MGEPQTPILSLCEYRKRREREKLAKRIVEVMRDFREHMMSPMPMCRCVLPETEDDQIIVDDPYVTVAGERFNVSRNWSHILLPIDLVKGPELDLRGDLHGIARYPIGGGGRGTETI